MKILMTADTVGGVWDYSLELIRALGRCDVQVTLATLGAPLSRAQRAEANTLAHLEIHTSRYRLEWMADPWAEVDEAGDWLLNLAARTRPDVVHLNHYAHGALPWPAPVLIVGHSCVLSWWQEVHGEPAPAEWEHYRRTVACSLQAAECVIAPTETMLSALKQHYGPLPHPGTIHNARDPQAYRPGCKEPFIMAAGRLWDEGKNIALLARVAPRLSWPVVVAGDTRGPDQENRQYPNVRMLGLLAPSRLADRLARAAIFVAPARYEPFGLAALEAGLSGCALILGDIPSLREVWGDAALYVPPRNADALELALTELIVDSALRAEYGRRARGRACRYSPERMAADYLAAYQGLRHVPEERPDELRAIGAL